MLRAYKYRIYPTEEQKAMLAKTFGCCRYVYNWALAEKKRAWEEEKRNANPRELRKRMTAELKHGTCDWLNEVSAYALCNEFEDLGAAYDRFFKKQGDFPRFKSKYGRQSFRDNGKYVKVNFKHGLLTIPKIKDITCVFHRRFKGEIRQVCIELLPSGKYYVSILVNDGKELPALAPIDPEKTIGIDTGLKHFAVLSDGQTFEPTHEAKKEARKLKLLSRRLARKQKGSRQFRIIKQRIARLHEHVKNRRQDHIHKITHYIASENQATTICVEDLNVKGMTRNKHLAYNIADAAIGEFYRQLEYKCRWTGKNYIKIDRWAPSSKMCGHCGYIYKALHLSERTWTCPECGTHHDRDLNAAQNIKAIGLGQKTLPSVRRKVKPVEKATVDDRASAPKKQPLIEAGKVKDNHVPMPQIFHTNQPVELPLSDTSVE